MDHTTRGSKREQFRRFFLAGIIIGKDEGHVPSVLFGRYVTSPPEIMFCCQVSGL